MLFGPVVPGFGPTPAKIAILGEAPGSEESEALRPFVGTSGRELRSQLRTIGVNLDDCYRTNVFSRMPDNSNIALYGTSSPSAEARALGALTSNPITYLDSRHFPELDRLRTELLQCRPNIIIALGNTATWALGLGTGVNNLRGAVHTTHFLGYPVKVLPTFHPAAVLRQWDTRVIALADLEKAHVESRSPDFNYDNTELWLSPTLDDLHEFGRLYMQGSPICATDVETKRGQITCVSFSPRNDYSLTVPFWIEGENPNYWGTVKDEAAALQWCARWIEDSSIQKVLQNGLYDIQYFIRYGMRPRNFTADTMLAHHSLYSEMRKGLGFLGSVYTNTQNWKSMRTFSLEENLKRDD